MSPSYSQKVASDFSAAASRYDEFASLQREVVDAAKGWLSPQQAMQKVLNAGAGTGYGAAPHWVSLDLAEQMAQQSQAFTPSLCADMQKLPFARGSFEGIFSSLAMQWLADLQPFAREAFKVTDAQGWLLGTTLVDETLTELKQAYHANKLQAPVLEFLHADAVIKAFTSVGWEIERVEQHTHITQYLSLREMLKSLKGLGANFKAESANGTGLRGRRWLQQLAASYPMDSEADALEASWQVLTFMARKPSS